MSSFEAVLAQRLVRECFGAAPSVVTCLLLQKESSTLVELLETSKLGWKLVRNSLVVLLKHGIVDLYIERLPGSDKTDNICSIQYSLNLDALFSRLRFAKFLLWAEARYKRAGRLLLLQVLKAGSMRAKDIIDGALHDFNTIESLIGDPNSSGEDRGESVTRHRLQELLGTLVVESVLARVETVEEQMKASRPKLSRRPIPEAKEVRLRGETGPQAAPVAGRAPPVRKRRSSAKASAARSLSSATTVLSNYSDNAPGLLLGTGDKPELPAKKKFRDGTSEPDNGTVSASAVTTNIAPDAVLRVNLNFLNLEIYKQTVENFISLRWSNFPLVRMIVRTLLLNARRSGHQIICSPMSFENICIGVNESIKKENIAMAARGQGQLAYFQSTKILQSLDGLDKHKDRFVKRIRRDNAETYQVDWQHVAEVLRHRFITQVVTTRYGLTAARVYALVLDSDGLGQAAIRAQTGGEEVYNDAAVYQNYSRFWNDGEVSDLGLVSPQVARRHLAELADSGFIRAHLADAVGAIPPTATVPTAKHCFVYGTREEFGARAAVNLCFQMALNVLERKSAEVEKLQRVVLKSTQLTQSEMYEQKLRELAEDSLEASLFAVDEGIMICRDL
eukprot:Protomagalhaensia_sp_Gyna_25__636@NODE_129_length_5021_cov_1218_892413_g19_i3_p1_GENE_NODE_129_length_5021_cov_1218_892413_g19_i3NODE_129_length_5021_cov_1218_892413_g19_i3_p1_ORF_typecomplete_len618_score99_90HTH_9/PF08221_11/5_9e09HTH_9/PF08221_11/7_1e02HTH_9/PF08221_11/5_1e03RNA_pol_Rpc82/PF05645_13/0_0022RNA_pol_Rpc82/PF05645_13/0_054RNA_pol_Rpc82/PF05645_13/2_5e03TFIIE_alpha/PF02002_17/0_095TFIIE_alpha/PF02002_17/6e02TFIIE_alpha/PF02002_17/2_6e03HTH_20/PF12840_7/1_6e04HTH_20/PF12840_7/0_2Le